MAEDVIYSRRSIRKYSKKDVPVEIIDQLIGAAMAAPSAKNRQPWKFVVMKNDYKEGFLNCMETGILKEEKQRALLPNSAFGIADAKNTLRIMKEAPCIIAVLNTNGKTPFKEINADDRVTEICDTLSIGASIENMILKATELDLGTLWVANTCFAYEDLVEYLGTDNQLTGAVVVGYANEHPQARPRKKIQDVAEYKF